MKCRMTPFSSVALSHRFCDTWALKCRNVGANATVKRRLCDSNETVVYMYITLMFISFTSVFYTLLSQAAGVLC